jgi:glycosyltransferase involved in cell wall biosynthesis
VESALAQTHAAEQVIVVDDGSRDATPEALARFGTRIEVLRQTNQGASAARNAGIRAARGTWVAFLDSDDRWLDSHLADLLAVVEPAPQPVWAFSTRLVELAPGAPPQPETPPESLVGLVEGNGVAADYLRVTGTGIPSATSTLMVRRELLRELGGFDVKLVAGEDLDLWWRIARDHPRVGVASTPSVVMTRHREDSLSARAREDSTGRHELTLVETVLRNLREARAAGRGAAFEPVAALHLEPVVERALARRDLALLRRVGWRNARLLPPRARVMLAFSLATGRPGLAALASARRAWARGRSAVSRA